MIRKTTIYIWTCLALLILLSCKKHESSQTDELSAPYQINSRQRLPLVNYVGNTQNVHPKVLFFPDTLFGHPYWMSYTPYPNGHPRYENPSVAYSNDGCRWQNIAANPLDVSSGVEGKYNSDSHLTYNPHTAMLECWYRYVDEEQKTETIYRRVSLDGVTWHEREQMCEMQGGVHLLSPCVYYNPERALYQIWVVDYQPSNSQLVYYESKDGSQWRQIRQTDLPYVSEDLTYKAWHADILPTDKGYVMVMMVKGVTDPKSWVLFYSESSDNSCWSTPKLLLRPRTECWDAQLYRSSLIQTPEGCRLYYSARSLQMEYGIGILEAPTLDAFLCL